MEMKADTRYRMLPEVRSALGSGRKVVALESAVITHGLPQGINLDLAIEVEEIIRSKGSVPATISLISGILCIGTNREELEQLAFEKDLVKVSSRTIGIAAAGNRSGGTTVAATLVAARKAGIKVFSTGGIGGVHRGNPFDISADLEELAHSPVIVVCAGAKAILDLPATREALETRCIPVLGYQTAEFPAFYSRSSGLSVDARVESPAEIVEIAQAHWEAGNSSAVLVTNPLPQDLALDGERLEELISKAVKKAHKEGIRGNDVTPRLLELVAKLTEGKSLQANLTLLKNNASLAADIAMLVERPGRAAQHTY